MARDGGTTTNSSDDDGIEQQRDNKKGMVGKVVLSNEGGSGVELGCMMQKRYPATVV